MNKKYFSKRPELKPTIYVYEIPDAENRKGLLKIGYTTRSAKGRIKEQLGTAGLNYNILLEQEAIRSDGSTFDDHEIIESLPVQLILEAQDDYSNDCVVSYW